MGVPTSYVKDNNVSLNKEIYINNNGLKKVTDSYIKNNGIKRVFKDIDNGTYTFKGTVSSNTSIGLTVMNTILPKNIITAPSSSKLAYSKKPRIVYTINGGKQQTAEIVPKERIIQCKYL